MNSHTPGPWQVVTELRDTDEIICDMLNNGYVAITRGQKLANWRNDAALIAAAPELLEALEIYAAVYNEHWKPGMPILEPISDAAIAKAKGEKA